MEMEVEVVVAVAVRERADRRVSTFVRGRRVLFPRPLLEGVVIAALALLIVVFFVRRCSPRITSHAASMRLFMKRCACVHSSAIVSSVLATIYASGSRSRGSRTGHRSLMSGRSEFWCLASAGIVVRRRERSELRSEGELEGR